MANAALTVFHRPYPRHDEHYKTQSHLFFEYARHWLPFIDTFYVVDASWGIPDHPRVRKIFADHMNHWEHFNRVIPKIEEENLLLLDSDTLIYDPTIVKDGFDRLSEYDCSAILDNSGQANLEEKYPILRANDKRDTRQRITPYLCFIKTNLLRGKDFTPVGGRFDSMGKITDQLLASDIKLHEMRDDRSTVRLKEDGTITQSTWLDGQGFDWSEPVNAPIKLGYYHLRNSTLGVCLLNEYKHDRQAYEHRKEITPPSEMWRVMAWQWIYDEKASELARWESDFDAVLDDYGLSRGVWDKYIRGFYNYHQWLNESPKAVKP